MIWPGDAVRLTQEGVDSIQRLLGLVPRLVAVVDQVEVLVARVRTLIGRVEETDHQARLVVEHADLTATSVDGVVNQARPLTEQAATLIARFEPALVKLEPVLTRLAEATSPQEVDAFVAITDMAPELGERLRTDIFPLLDTLQSVAPDLRDLLEVSRELNEMLGSLPGVGRIKRRIEDEHEEKRQSHQDGG